MTPEEKAKATLDQLSGNGKLTEAQAAKFLDLVTDTTEKTRAKWRALPWYVRFYWRLKERTRGVFGLSTRMPYHVGVVRMTPNYNHRFALNKFERDDENKAQ